jgi:phage terminase small subunit
VAAGDLNPKQQAFVDEYLVDLNATQAAIRAGYSEASARQIGTENLSKPSIQAAIQAAFEGRADRLGVTQDDVVKALMAIAFADVRQVSEWGREPVDENDQAAGERSFLRLRASADLSDEIAVALQEVRIDGHGQLVVKLSDRIRALELLGRHLGMFKRDVDVNVRGGITLSMLAEWAGDDEPAA